MGWLRRLSLRGRRFSPLEVRLFAAVREVLPADAQPILDAQVDAVTHVQRLAGWTEIDYYRRRFGRTDWSNIPKFPLGAEAPLARVRFAVQGRRYRATLSCVDGHVFDFGISPSPEDVAFTDWDSAPEAELLTDPLNARPAGEGAALPPVWEDVLQRTAPQATARGWTLHRSGSARRVALHEGEFLVLAERDGDEFILQRLDPPSGSIFWMASHDAPPEDVGDRIDELLRRPRRRA